MEATGPGCPAEDCDLSKSVRCDSSQPSKFFMADVKGNQLLEDLMMMRVLREEKVNCKVLWYITPLTLIVGFRYISA